MFGFGKTRKSSEALAVLVERGEFDLCLQEIRARAGDLAPVKAKFALYLETNKREGIINEQFLPAKRALILDSLLAAAASPAALARSHQILQPKGELHRLATGLANHQPDIGGEAINPIPPKVAALRSKGVKSEDILKHIDLIELTSLNASHMEKFKKFETLANQERDRHLDLLGKLIRAATAKKSK